MTHPWKRRPIGDVGPGFRQRRTVVGVKPALSARIAGNLAATGVRTSRYGTRGPAELSVPASNKQRTQWHVNKESRRQKGATHGR
jgi:hypothetical protein